MDRPTVLSIGNLNLDIYMKIGGLPGIDEAVDAFEAYVGGGGSAANFSVQVAKLGLGSRFIGSVGTDTVGDILVDELRNLGIDTRFIKRIAYEKTGTVTVLVGLDGSKRMIAYRGANMGLIPSDLDGAAIEGISHIHLATGRTEIIEAGFRKGRSMGATVSIDGGTNLARKGIDVVAALIRGIDVMFMNSVEAKILSGVEDPIKAGFSIYSKVEPQELIITLGPKGALCISGNGSKVVESFRVTPIDTTGAGDVFAASYISARLMGLDIVERLIFANASASISVTRRGARSGPRLDEVLEFLSSIGYREIVEKLANENQV
ncbi:MAG: carbohydrate kinase family protein [Thermocladium sp.]